MKLLIEAEQSAGGPEFLNDILAGVDAENDSVLIQVAGLYGHLYITHIEILEED